MQNRSLTNEQLSMNCRLHPQYILTHGCSKEDCQFDCLFCSECLIESLEHLTQHRQFIQPLQKFIIELQNQLHKTQQMLKPFENIPQQVQSSQLFFNNYINQQKDSINSSLKQLCDEFFILIENTRNKYFNLIDGYQIKVIQHLESLQKQVRNDDFIKVNDFQNTIISLQPDQKLEFIYRLKQQISHVNSNSINQQVQMDSINKMLRTIRNNSDVVKLDFVVNSQLQLQQLQQEMSMLMKSLVQKMNSNMPIEKNSNTKDNNNLFNGSNSSFNYQNNTSNTKKNRSNISYSKSPIAKNQNNNNSQYNQNINNKSKMTAFNLNSQINNSLHNSNEKNMINNQPQKQYSFMNHNTANFNNNSKIGKEFMKQQQNIQNIRVDLRQNFSGSLKFDIKKEVSLDLEQSEISKEISQCMVQISSDEIGLGYNSGNIKIVRIEKSVYWKLKVICELNGEQMSIRSMCMLQDQEDKICQIGVGDENGKIVVWGYNKEKKEGRVEIVLKDEKQMVEAITVVLDIGAGCLVAGDITGQLLLWGYQLQTLFQTFTIHTMSITQIILINQSKQLAVSAEDGLISIWNYTNTQMQCIKIIKNEASVYSIRDVLSQNYLVISDSKNRARILDYNSFIFLNESQPLINGEYIHQILEIDFLTNQAVYPLLLCFTRQGLILMDGENLEGLQYFDDLNNNLLSLNNGDVKVLFQSKYLTNNQIYFLLLNQNPNSNKHLALYSLNF